MLARRGESVAAGRQRVWGPEPQHTGGSFLFDRHNTDTNIQSHYAKV